MRVLITGVTGFAGSHLCDLLLTKEDVEIFGVKRWRSQTENIEHLQSKITLLEGDIRDSTSMREILKKVRPDRIFHLAAQSFVLTSWKLPMEVLETNIMGQLNLLEGVRSLGLDPLIHIAGSSEEYGLVQPEDLPLKEETPLRPLSPYGVSKVVQDLLGFQYFKSYGMRIIRTRGFNHTGPRRGSVFVTSDFAHQISLIEKKRIKPVIRVGNLEAVRDFTDVRDMMRGYWLALEKGEPGEVYNIASGKGIKIREVLDCLLKLSGVEVKIEEDPEKMRPSDVPILIGDSHKFREKSGWRPEIPFEKTLRDILDYWRERI
ncbi:GDP-mannose 4,6-dehydratase [candidate division TA06 bacterium]|nr:GDP-mannose 4,6-dehydratase [candidate division TA06 bacterium]